MTVSLSFRRVSGILDAVPSFTKFRGSRNDDLIDRVSHVYTVLVLLIFAIVSTTDQYVGTPLHCWYPSEFRGWYEKYAEFFCWTSSTYVVSWDEPIPFDVSKRKDNEITYYQWVPLILALQAFLFKLPHLVWKLLHDGAGINLDKVVEMAAKTQLGSSEDREQTILHLALHLDKWMETEKPYRYGRIIRLRDKIVRYCCFICSKRTGKYLTALFLITKVLFLGNVIAQFFLLNAFLATNYNVYGFELIDSLKKNDHWKESPRFPRVTYCDFQVRQSENIQRWTIQCVLSINLFNEKVFIFLWFWFFFVATLACFNLLNWIYIISLKRNRFQYVKKYLKVNLQLQNDFDKKLCYRFADYYLRDDGVFVLRVIAKNSTDLVIIDLVTCLWKIFLDKQNKASRPYIDAEGTLRPFETQPDMTEEETETVASLKDAFINVSGSEPVSNSD
ncbi:hypothetical protein ACJMK2_014006 [Sinanodonta woodiana]|uniref:Innexin n=1 Tax=Sinanodonta woodiana TaxID=1069815 RepID=A0ABD3UZT4_SINWO